MKTLKTISAVIKALSGPVKASRWANTSSNAVCWWRHRGIPPGLHLRLVLEMSRRGYAVDKAVLQLEDEEYSYLYGEIFPPPSGGSNGKAPRAAA